MSLPAEALNINTESAASFSHGEQCASSLLECINEDMAAVGDLIKYPPSDTLLNCYWAEEVELNEEEVPKLPYIPNWEGQLGIWAYGSLVSDFNNDLRRVMVAGGTRAEFGGVRMSEIYAQYLNDLSLPNTEVCYEGSSRDEASTSAESTRGELDFFRRVYFYNSSIHNAPLIITRAPHHARVSEMASHAIPEARVVSAEGILAHYMPGNIKLSLEDPEVLEEYLNFMALEASAQVRVLMAVDGGRGRFLELVAKATKPVKSAAIRRARNIQDQ